MTEIEQLKKEVQELQIRLDKMEKQLTNVDRLLSNVDNRTRGSIPIGQMPETWPNIPDISLWKITCGAPNAKTD